MWAAAPSRHHDVDSVCGTYHRYRLAFVIGIHKSGPKVATVRVALGRATAPQFSYGFSGVLK